MQWIPCNGWVYAAREEGTPLVKIGFTSGNPQQRMITLRYEFHITMSLLAAVRVLQVARRMERAVHKALAASCIQGEWFYLYMDQHKLECLICELMPAVMVQAMKDQEARRAYLARDSSRSSF